MKIVRILDAKDRVFQLLRITRAGSKAIVADRGDPELSVSDVAKGTAASILECVRARPLHDNRRSSQEIDEAIAAERSAWG